MKKIRTTYQKRNDNMGYNIFMVLIVLIFEVVIPI